MKRIVKRRGRREEVARDAEHGRDRVRHRRRDLLRAGLDVAARARVAEPRELVRVRRCCDGRPAARAGSRARSRPAARAATARAPSRARAVPSTVTVAASPRDMPRLRHHEPDRVLEDEREEDADEDDQERVADRREAATDADRGGDEQTVRIGSERARRALIRATLRVRSSARLYAAGGRNPSSVRGLAAEDTADCPTSAGTTRR